VVKSNSPSGYAIGTQKGGSGATTTFDPTEHYAGQTVFLVGKYDFTAATQTSPGWFQFTDVEAANIPSRFYQLRWP